MSKEPSNKPSLSGIKIIKTKKAISYPADHAPDISDAHIEDCDEGIISRDPVNPVTPKDSKIAKWSLIVAIIGVIVAIFFGIVN